MHVTLIEGFVRAAYRSNNKLNRFLINFFETADLQSYCGYFLAFFQLCFRCFEKKADGKIDNFIENTH